MLTMTNALTIDGYTVYRDDSEEVDGVPSPQGKTFYILPDKPAIAKDENGKPIFSLVVYRRDEERIDPANAESKDVGGGILTFTVELAIADDVFRQVRGKLNTLAFGSAGDPSQQVNLTYVPFLDGTVSVAVAGETGADSGGDGEFVKGAVGTGKIAGVGGNRKAVMVKLTQEGAALMSQLEKLTTLPINVQYALSFEHRLLGVTMRVWCDINSSYSLVQSVTHSTDDYSDGYLGMSSNHVDIDKVTAVTETMVRSKTAGVTVIPQSSQVDNDTLSALEKMGFDMLNQEMNKALQAAPPPAELDRTYLTQYSEAFFNDFNFTLDRRMVLVQNFTPSANVSNVFQQGNFKEMVAFVDLRTAFFSFLKVPIRVNADFSKLPLDSVTVTVTYQRERIGGGGREDRIDSFDFTDGSAIQTFLAYANSLADVAYDWKAVVHYKGSQESYTLSRHQVQDEFLVIDVGQLGMIMVDLGLGLVDLDRFPKAKVSLRYASTALGRTLEQEFLLDSDHQSALWTEVIHEEPTAGYEVKIDWLRKDGTILPGDWAPATSSRLRFDAPVPAQLTVSVATSGNFKEAGHTQISVVAVSLSYTDPDNHYAQSGTLNFTAENQVLPWSVDLRNADLRDYQYRYSIVYKDGLEKDFPPDGSWYKGQPGFITVGEKYTLEVQVYPTLLTYPDGAKLVQANLTYDDPDHGIHQVDGFVFSRDSSQPRTWRVRGDEQGPKTYDVQLLYFTAAGAVTTVEVGTRDSDALVIPPAPPAAPGP